MGREGKRNEEERKERQNGKNEGREGRREGKGRREVGRDEEKRHKDVLESIFVNFSEKVASFSILYNNLVSWLLSV